MSVVEITAPLATLENISRLLELDNKVKLAGIDVDGILRGKLVSKKKFLSIAKDGFGFCSVVFGWDMHDRTYFKELTISNKENGYRDLIAVPDLSSYRRIPWENDVPFFLVSFFDPDTRAPVSACPRGLLRAAVAKLENAGYKAMAGAEYEFYQFRAPPDATGPEQNSSSTALFLKKNSADTLPSITEGMFGYSLTRPVHNQEYYYSIFDTCQAFRYVVKSLGSKHGITPAFMAKPREGLPGNSGHMHISIVSDTGKNAFFREEPDPSAPYPDLVHLSDLGRQFLAGLLTGLPDMMPIFGPTINSYKRLVENYWAPVTVSWGLEHRAASIRLIAPPTASPKATRFEVRLPGADANPHFVLATVVALGWRGVEKKLEIPIPPLGEGGDIGGVRDKGVRLAKNLKDANEMFMREGSVAREVFGDDFVDHFGGTREHEVMLWQEAVTDWEVRRYIETV
ncbi:hypothetical protein Egran_05146 [Elaphomyces granulatus]|uniref:Glutamine synthetase n=1 Tax=Elaphomyces granulatus TaxID=519963 RepID=A0A232LSU0_9EURO|nr:hypothetical protein Egran_05146 [Elaphomyces granulatus]